MSASGVAGIQQDEIRVRVNRPQHAGVGLVAELLSVVGVPLKRRAHVLGIVECRDGGHAATLDSLKFRVSLEPRGGGRRGDGIADTQSGQAMDVEKLRVTMTRRSSSGAIEERCVVGGPARRSDGRPRR